MCRRSGSRRKKAELRAEDVAFLKKMRMYCINNKKDGEDAGRWGGEISWIRGESGFLDSLKRRRESIESRWMMCLLAALRARCFVLWSKDNILF